MTQHQKGFVIETCRTMALAGKTTRDIRRVLHSNGVPDASIKTALNRLRKKGLVAPRAKLRPNYYQISLHPEANKRLVAAAAAKGLQPADLARIWLHLATRELAP